MEKITKVNEFIEFFLQTGRRKATVLQIQQLCRYLNFLCRCIIPGHAFTTRLYSLLISKGRKLKAHHHVNITEETKQELRVWKRFLELPEVFCRPFLQSTKLMVSEIFMYSDASGKIGFGAICQNDWMFGFWQDFL